MVRDKAGNLYVGTGTKARFSGSIAGERITLLRIQGARHLRVGDRCGGVLYVGTSPEGKVYKVTPRSSRPSSAIPRTSTSGRSVRPVGNLYVGTGGRGLILKVDPGGKKSTFYDSDDTHVVSLARGSDGSLLAGTSPGGMVISLNAQGKAFTLLDTSLEEVRALAVDRFGTIYAVAASSKGLPAAQSAKGEISVETTGAVLPIATIQALSGLGEKPKDSAVTVSAPGGEKDGSGARASIYAFQKTVEWRRFTRPGTR